MSLPKVSETASDPTHSSCPKQREVGGYGLSHALAFYKHIALLLLSSNPEIGKGRCWQAWWPVPLFQHWWDSSKTVSSRQQAIPCLLKK